MHSLPVRVSEGLGEGGLIGKLEIPGTGFSVMVLQGVEEETLLLGAGHVPGTPLPGREGNSVIAGQLCTAVQCTIAQLYDSDFSTLRPI